MSVKTIHSVGQNQQQNQRQDQQQDQQQSRPRLRHRERQTNGLNRAVILRRENGGVIGRNHGLVGILKLLAKILLAATYLILVLIGVAIVSRLAQGKHALIMGWQMAVAPVLLERCVVNRGR